MAIGRPATHSGIESRSIYVAMDDGVKLAVDVHLPSGLAAGAQLPTILHQTRYWRSLQLRAPISWFVDGYFLLFGGFRRYFVERGYAWVDVDVRGTGSSLGTWRYSYWPRELRDGVEIVDWIVRQPWSNGVVGAWGVSYAGGAAEMTLARPHAAVKAVAAMFSPYDVYDDIALPGGVLSEWYIGEWGRVNQALDEGRAPVTGFVQRVAVAGPRPVDGYSSGDFAAEFAGARAENLDVVSEAAEIVFRDDSSRSVPGLDSFSPHRQTDVTSVPVYGYSGWFDGAYQHAAIKRFLSRGHPADRLTIGPWDHGGENSASPFAPSPSAFDHRAALLQFFDEHLLGLRAEDVPRVRYFTMGREAWESSDSWPPSGLTPLNLYLSDPQALSREAPDHLSSADTLSIDFTAGTGSKSRWTALVGPTGDPELYPDWTSRLPSAQRYVTSPVRQDTEVTGHPLITLYVSSSASDGQFFVYLEDVSPSGEARYVTEGMLRALHRNSVTTEIHQDVVPVRDYLRSSAAPLRPGEVVQLSFDLLPTSYVFKEGHRIRIAITGADADYFRRVPEVRPTVLIWRGSEFPSSIVLPARNR